MSTAQTEITVYNQGMGLVKETRTMVLKKGRQEVSVPDVAQLIDTTSVGYRWLTNPGSVSVLEQNYQYDLISPMSILNKSVGKRVKFTRTFGNQKDVLEGILISAPTSIVNSGDGAVQTYNGLVIKTDTGRIILSPQGEVEVSELPEGLISVPSLLWDLESTKDQKSDVELSYITGGMSWNANYVLTIDGKGKGDLQGWVTMNNQSGLTFKDAKLKLLAGDVNVVQPKNRGMVRTEMMKVAEAPGGGRGGFQEETLFEYHLYTLGRPASVRNKETKQLSLLEGFNVPVQKQIIFDSMAGYDSYYPSEGEIGTGSLSPQVRIKFVNDEKSGLGMPLPAGKIRLYTRDASGSVQLLGEDMIKHSPRDEKISMVVGRAFDIRADRKRTKYQRISDRSFRESFEIELRNRKKDAETVFLYERHWGDWKVTEKSDNFVKEDATTMVFEIKLAPGEVKKVTYTVETRW